jgi:hypothetical protein
MELFDLEKIKVYPYKESDKNVFFKSNRFKAGMIRLHAGESMTACEMKSFVVFIVIEVRIGATGFRVIVLACGTGRAL